MDGLTGRVVVALTFVVIVTAVGLSIARNISGM